MNTAKAIDADRLMSFDEVRCVAPLADQPRRPDLSAIWRWHVRGILVADGRRVHLRAERVGRFLYTKPCWVQEFLEATQAGRARPPEEAAARVNKPVLSRSPRRRRRDRAAAARTLDSAGI